MTTDEAMQRQQETEYLTLHKLKCKMTPTFLGHRQLSV